MVLSLDRKAFIDIISQGQGEIGGVGRLTERTVSAACRLGSMTPATLDIEPIASSRFYHFAGTQHSAGTLPLTDTNPKTASVASRH
jgi:hypothetical protein